jgi:hypothetical protein
VLREGDSERTARARRDQTEAPVGGDQKVLRSAPVNVNPDTSNWFVPVLASMTVRATAAATAAKVATAATTAFGATAGWSTGAT